MDEEEKISYALESILILITIIDVQIFLIKNFLKIRNVRSIGNTDKVIWCLELIGLWGYWNNTINVIVCIMFQVKLYIFTWKREYL